MVHVSTMAQWSISLVHKLTDLVSLRPRPSCWIEPKFEKVIIPDHSVFLFCRWVSLLQCPCLIKSVLQFFYLLTPHSYQAITCYLKLATRIYFFFLPHLEGGRISLTSFILFLFCACLFTTSGFLLNYLAGKMIFIGKRELWFCSSQGNGEAGLSI